jgi:hypothetical protein
MRIGKRLSPTPHNRKQLMTMLRGSLARRDEKKIMSDPGMKEKAAAIGLIPIETPSIEWMNIGSQ